MWTLSAWCDVQSEFVVPGFECMVTLLMQRSFSLLSQPRIVTNDTQLEERKVPAALNLPFGKLFFGYQVVPVGGEEKDAEENKSKQVSPFLF